MGRSRKPRRQPNDRLWSPGKGVKGWRCAKDACVHVRHTGNRLSAQRLIERIWRHAYTDRLYGSARGERLVEQTLFRLLLSSSVFLRHMLKSQQTERA